MESSTVALEHEHRIVQKDVACMTMPADELEEGKPAKPQLLMEIVESLRGSVDQCLSKPAMPTSSGPGEGKR